MSSATRSRRSARSLITHAGCVASMLAACNGRLAGGTASDAPASADAAPGVIDSGATHPPDAGEVTIGSFCPVAVTQMDIAEVNPPKPGLQGSCTDAELATLTRPANEIVERVSPACASCLFTEHDDTTNTQFFVWYDSMHLDLTWVNHGACFGTSLSGGSPACGRSTEEISSCLEAACPSDGMGRTTCEISVEECVTAALANDCKGFHDRQIADCGGATALATITAKCLDAKGGIAPGVRLLCGNP